MKKIYKLFLCCLIAGSIFSCSDLEEEVYSEVVSSTFFQTKEQIIGAYTRPWAHVEWVFPHSIFHITELSADAAAWTAKATGDGYDGGKWITLHNHKWTAKHNEFNAAWADLWKGVAFTNAVLEGIEDVDFTTKNMPITKVEMTSQLKCLRAYLYYIACDLWGNVPIVTKVADPEYPTTNSRKEVYAFIESELLSVIPNLGAKSDENYGYFSKSAAQTLLAKLYINSKVFTGTEEYQKCIDACDAVISSGNYQLDGGWQDPFLSNNDISKENIFAFALNGTSSFSYSLSVKTLHYAHQEGFNLSFGTWNGIVTQETFYDSYNDLDLRKNQYLIGAQYKAGTTEPLLCSRELDGQPLVITKSVTAMNGAGENEGARCYKYPLDPGTMAHNPKNDLVILRYADVLYMKAEALMRMNGGVATAEAVNLINPVRQRAFGTNYETNGKYTTTTLTMDELLADRGREFSYEGYRRNDLIRFGKFNSSWWEKDVSEEFRALYPIPFKQVNINPNLTQNEGY